MNQRPDAAAILQDAAATLQNAEWGLTDLLGPDPKRRIAGMQNVVVWGRAVTNVLHRLKSAVGKGAYCDWYLPHRTAMEQDELMKYFYRLRSPILKRGETGPISMTMLGSVSTTQLQPLWDDPPPAARNFFVGDNLGGSGWLIDLPDGTTDKIYVELPDDIEVEMTFQVGDPPTLHKGEPITDTSMQALARLYLNYLSDLIAEATERFAR
jgi:hypothetical protein